VLTIQTALFSECTMLFNATKLNIVENVWDGPVSLHSTPSNCTSSQL